MSAPSEPSSADGHVENGRDTDASPYRAGHPLVRYVLRRIGVSVLLVVGVTLVTFVLTNLVPGDTVAANLGQQAAADPTIVAAYRAHYGLDLSAAVPATLEIAIGAIAASILIGVGFGVVAAVRRGRLADSALRLVSVVGISVPTFWLAMVAFYVFSYQLDIAPGSGRLSPADTAPPTVTGLYTVDSLLAGQWATFADAVAHLMLPTLVLTLYTVGLLTRFARSAVLEVLDQDFVRSARAKGLPGGTVLLRYVLRAALVPILTVVGLAFGALLSGTVLVEQIFSWPGMGSYAYQAASHLDLPGVMGVGLVVGVIYVVINLIVDLLYGVIDPRVRVG
jgi:peptide/nickel transport system permease protein